MRVTATLRHARMAPRKIRPLARLLRGMSVQEAATQLQFLPGKAPKIVEGVLQSAVANSEHNHDLAAESLAIAEARVDEGIVMKRFQPVARGMAHPRLKRTSHVTIVLEGEPAVKQAKGAKKKADKDSIATISVDEYETFRAESQEEEEQELTKEVPEKRETEERTVAERTDKRDYEARQKKRAVQQGGDAKKRHRRTSKKGDS